MKTGRISFVIPVYNSENTIARLIESIISIYSEAEEVQIILVNDNSSDRSEEVCRKKAEEDDRVLLINLAKNFGQHNALLTGLRFADGEVIVCMDDDLQNPPEEAKKLIDAINKNADVVYGNYKELMESPLRKAGSRLNGIMAQILIGKPKGIEITSFFAMKKFINDEVVKYKGPYPYLPGLLFRATSAISSVEVSHMPRKTGKSNYNFSKLVSLWMNGFTNFSVKPLRFASLAGAAAAFLGFIYLAVIVIRKLLNPAVPLGWTSLMAIVLLMGGIQLVTIGLAGEYIGRMFLTANEKPQSVVRSTVRKGKG